MPSVPCWSCEELVYVVKDEDEADEERIEKLDFWYRNIIEVVQEILENPDFKDDMCYQHEKIYSDNEQEERIYNEMWTADWWPSVQVCHISPSINK